MVQQADAVAHRFGLVEVEGAQKDGLTLVTLPADEVEDDGPRHNDR